MTPQPDVPILNGGALSSINGALSSVAQILASIVKIGVLPCIAAYLVYIGAKTLPDLALRQAVMQEHLTTIEELMRQSNNVHEKLIQAVERQCVVMAASSHEDVRKCYPQP